MDIRYLAYAIYCKYSQLEMNAGHMLQLHLAPRYGDYEFTWLEKFGPIYRLKGCFGEDRLMVSDPIALQYILKSASLSTDPPSQMPPSWCAGRQMWRLSKVAFLISIEMITVCLGDAHRRVRTALNPGFTAMAVKNYQ